MIVCPAFSSVSTCASNSPSRKVEATATSKSEGNGARDFAVAHACLDEGQHLLLYLAGTSRTSRETELRRYLLVYLIDEVEKVVERDDAEWDPATVEAIQSRLDEIVGKVRKQAPSSARHKVRCANRTIMKKGAPRN